MEALKHPVPNPILQTPPHWVTLCLVSSEEDLGARAERKETSSQFPHLLAHSHEIMHITLKETLVAV